MKQHTAFTGSQKTMIAQGGYYVITGVWPLIHVASFMYVTGPKTDIWLLKMTSLLITSIGIYLLAGVREKNTKLLAVLAAISFTIIDVYYVFAGVISRVYLGDALIEILLLGLLFMTGKGKK
jgi:hypothetical protein